MPNNVRSRDQPTTGQSRNTRIAELIQDRQLIVASNRQPYRHDFDDETKQITVDRPTGGLTAGLDPVMQRIGGTWIAWGDGDKDSEVVDSNDCVSVPPDDPSYQLKRVWLSDAQVNDYYYGFSNQVLWPVSHSALTRVRCDAGFWDRYSEVNERFATAVTDHVDDRPVIWFQDYHLALAPQMMRPDLPDDTLVMHFWHIPWPSWDTFRACPHHREVLEGLLGNDLLAFHTSRYRSNFLESVDAAVDEATVDRAAGEVVYEDHVTSVEAIPMGVPFEKIERTAENSSEHSFMSPFEGKFDVPPGTQIGVGVDRLDYTKGIVERLRALERVWETNPEWRGEFTFVQIGSKSRSKIRAYRQVQERVSEVVERINSRFRTDDWQPIVYTTDRLSREELYGIFRHSTLGIVSPIRDGMNLVAQEYVAAQKDANGILLLSDQAGTYDEYGEYALSITPTDTKEFAQAITRALDMSPVERRIRMRALRESVDDNDLYAWLEKNITSGMRKTATGTRVAPTEWNASESQS